MTVYIVQYTVGDGYENYTYIDKVFDSMEKAEARAKLIKKAHKRELNVSRYDWCGTNITSRKLQ